MDTSFGTQEPGESAGGGSGLRARRFCRSSRDRRMAGVAGGIGRALGIDPVIIRVAFAVLTLFGGSGIALYALGWLLMPAENDEVSALESLLGRGRSSTSGVLTVILGLVVVGSFTSTLTWGLSLLPFAGIALVVFLVFGHQRRQGNLPGHGRGRRRRRDDHHGGVDWADRQSRPAFGRRTGQQAQSWGEDFGARAGAWGEDFGARAGTWGEEVGRRAEAWGDRVKRHAQRWGDDVPLRNGTAAQDGPGRSSGAGHLSGDEEAGRSRSSGASPFAESPSWDSPRSGSALPVRSGWDSSPDSTDSARVDDSRSGGSDPITQPAATTPPRWDPLGAAPFAWDLPEPGPTPPSPELLRRQRRSRVAAAGTAALAAAVAAIGGVGVWLDWWTLPLAWISGAALAVVAVFVLGSALRGNRSPLAGLVVLLILATGFLAATGITGKGGISETNWVPSTSELAGGYRLDAGHGVLDLRSVRIPHGTTVTVSASIGAGNLEVLLPPALQAEVTCTANLGTTNCLGQQNEGVRPTSAVTATGDSRSGTLVLNAHVGTGEVDVRR